jgi:hypothetical protein
MNAKTRKPTPAEASALITAIRDAEHNRRSYADFFATNARADMIARMAAAGWVTGKGQAARVTPAGREAVASIVKARDAAVCGCTRNPLGHTIAEHPTASDVR